MAKEMGCDTRIYIMGRLTGDGYLLFVRGFRWIPVEPVESKRATRCSGRLVAKEVILGHAQYIIW